MHADLQGKEVTETQQVLANYRRTLRKSALIPASEAVMTLIQPAT
jgi:hypothetical protein